MTEVETHSWKLESGGSGHELAGEIHLPSAHEGRLPFIVFSNDLLYSLGWAFYPFLAAKVSRVHPFLTYNPTYSGYRGRSCLLEAPEEVEHYTVGSELEDLERILAAVRQGTIPGAERLDPERVIAAGHGKGAGLALLLAARRPEVKAVLCMSALSTLLRFPPEVQNEIRATGYLEVAAPISGTKVRLSRAMLTELEEHPDAFSLKRAIQAIDAPLVIMHGEEDREVSVKESESLYHWCEKDRARLVLMEKVGHMFGADHPFTHSNKELDRVVEVFINFISQSLD